MQETWIRSLVRKIPWKREWLPAPVFLPGEFQEQRNLVGLQSTVWQTVRHNWESNTFTFSITDSVDMNLSKLKKIVKDQGTWWAAVHGMSKSRRWLRNWTTTKAWSLDQRKHFSPLKDEWKRMPLISEESDKLTSYFLYLSLLVITTQNIIQLSTRPYLFTVFLMW